jgi:Ecdysteroid kinase-like family
MSVVLAFIHKSIIGVCHFTGGINLSSFLTHTHEALWTGDEAHPAAKWIPSAIDTLMDVAQKPGCKFGRRVAEAGARQKLAAAFSAARALVAPSHKYANCVCHGDVWNNNFMLKYDERGEAQAARLVDMQVPHFNYLQKL